MQRLLERLTIHVVPMLNPDGARALPAAQRAGARRQPRRAAAPGARRAASQGAARPPAARARLQPAQPGLAHVGREDEAGLDLAAGRRVRRGSDRDAGADAGEDAPARSSGRRWRRWRPGRSRATTTSSRCARSATTSRSGARPSSSSRPGPYPGESADQELVKLNVVAILTALDALATGAVQGADPALYESLPINDDEVCSP